MRLSDAETYEKYADELVRFATALVGPDDAADVVADTFVRMLGWRGWSEVEEQKPYLYRSVLNEARMRDRSRLRRRARERRAAEREAVQDPEVRPEVLAAVGALSPRQRAVVFFTYWEDMSVGDVADRLGISDGSVRRHLARARARLRRVLDE